MESEGGMYVSDGKVLRCRLLGDVESMENFVHLLLCLECGVNMRSETLVLEIAARSLMSWIPIFPGV